MKLKICGITDFTNIEEIIQVGSELDYLPDYLGFITYEKSPRYISSARVLKLLEIVTKPIKKVLVVVDIQDEILQSYLENSKFDAIQFHGNENPAEIVKLKNRYPNLEIIKAIKIKSEEDLFDLQKYSSCVDQFVFDAAGKNPGGNGIQFSWDLLTKYTGEIPFLLSGGISIVDFDRIVDLKKQIPALNGIDVNSGFEDKPGFKNPEKIKVLLRSLKNEFSS